MSAYKIPVQMYKNITVVVEALEPVVMEAMKRPGHRKGAAIVSPSGESKLTNASKNKPTVPNKNPAMILPRYGRRDFMPKV
jgi:hypothetical protein